MNEYNVFISYPHDEAGWAGDFASALQELGVNAWMDATHLRPGESIRGALENAMRGSDAIVAVLSPSNAKSPSVFFDLGVALGMGKPLIPIIPTEMQNTDLPIELRRRRHLVKDSPKKAAMEVAEALRALAA